MERKEAEKIAKEFFKRRFPDKDINKSYEKSYFEEWVQRFMSGNPEGYMDNQSLMCWKIMKHNI